MKSSDSLKSLEQGIETDPRFPSGPWVGFWMQQGFGKQKMSLQSVVPRWQYHRRWRRHGRSICNARNVRFEDWTLRAHQAVRAGTFH